MGEGIVGRDRELAAAQVVLAGLPKGPQALLLEGEAGIGKTAVWRAVRDEAVAQEYRVLSCVGDQSEVQLSFVGLSDMLRDVSDEVLEELPTPQRDAIERALGRRRSASGRENARAIGFGLLSLVIRLAHHGPVLLAVDDVQWLDPGTARALAFVMRRLEGHRVGAIAAVRAPLAAPEPLGLERTLGPDRFTRVQLGPLALDALRVTLERQLGFRYTRPVMRRIAEVSGGNPMFALELAKTLGAAPVLEAGVPLPAAESLRELVAERVASLARPARLALLAASALSDATEELVRRAASTGGLAAAEEAGLLRVEARHVVFAHPLFASAVYAAATSSQRRAMHARLAYMVSGSEASAQHLALASIPPDAGVAAALDAAAAQARARGAWDAAGELLEQARTFTPPGQPVRARERTVAAAEHHVHAGDRRRARALLDGVLEEVPPGRLRSDALRLLAEILYDDDDYATIPGLLDEALEHARDPALVIRLELTLGYVYLNNLFDFGRGDRHAQTALDRAIGFGDDALLGEALAFSAMASFLLGRGVDWAIVERAVRLEDSDRLVPIHLRPSLIAALLRLYVGRFAEAREELTLLRRAARASGDESGLALVLLWLGYLELQAGDFAEAAAVADEALLHTELTGSLVSRTMVLSLRALVHAHRGESAEARADAAEVRESCASLGLVHPLLFASSAIGLLELSLANPAASFEAARQLIEITEQHGIAEPVVQHFLPIATESLVMLGELDRAAQLLDSFEQRAQALDRTWAVATGARCRGLLLAANGDLEGAEQALQRALDEHARLAMPFEHARTLLVQGQLLRRRRRRQAARETFEHALQLFDQLGTPIWADRARAELERLGAARARGALTPAEQRVAELAAAGHSNKEIASALFVSVHTVELHLSHSYAKLGIRSRSQLADHLTPQV